MGSTPVARLRRTVSNAQLKAANVLRALRASTHPPPLLPPHQDETPPVVIPPDVKKDDEKK